MPTETKQLKPRPPVVAVLGHVDHGKTTLLDYLRKTNVAAREAGGITQSIGAYEIEHGGKKITFIDTPGHEAFSKMRSRGCSAADLAILVVAADEGVKPQTQESIATLRASQTPFVVAITKIDKPGADIERVKNDLATAEVFLEGYGGQVSFQPVSAKSGDHVQELLDLVLLAAEVEELTYDPTAPAGGFVLESKMDRQRGLEATVVVKDGTLRQGALIGTPTAKGKVKILENFLGKTAKELEPSAPALIIGFETLPQVGEQFMVGAPATAAAPAAAPKAPAPLAVSESEETLNCIVKAVDAGSLEAFTEILRNLPSERPVKVVNAAVGDVVDNDVKLAISTGSLIFAFGNRIEKGAATHAEANSIRIVSSKIIYELVRAAEEVIAAGGKGKPAGVLEVLAVFGQAKLEKQVIGGRIAEGTVRNRALFGIERAGAMVGDGRVGNLQQQKKDVSQASAGEAGLLVSAPVAIEKGDRLVFRN